MIFAKIEKLAAACRGEIDASDRPYDAMPTEWILPVFFVQPEHLTNWEQSIPSEVSDRITRLKLRPELLVISETDLRRTPFALSHAEILKFRKGPLLRMLSLVDLRLARNKGGRTKRLVELSIRDALEFEVFRRDPEIGALLSCMRARFNGADRPVAKGLGLEALTQLAWVSGIPTKRRAADKNLCEEDRRLALFESLRLGGEKHAVRELPGLKDPAQAEASIVAQVRDRAPTVQSRVQFQTAIEVAASWVHTLMKACAYVTDVAEEKHQLAKRAVVVDRLTRPPKGDNPFRQEPITSRQHSLFARNQFTPLELAFIAVAADVDPNLLTSNHISNSYAADFMNDPANFDPRKLMMLGCDGLLAFLSNVNMPARQPDPVAEHSMTDDEDTGGPDRNWKSKQTVSVPFELSALVVGVIAGLSIIVGSAIAVSL